MNIKYRVKFETKNSSIAENRELKINLINSNYLMEFDSDSIPFIPKVSSKVNICNELYVILDVIHSYIMEGSQIYNLITISIESEKSIERRENERKAGYAGIDNLLFYDPKCSMFFGDAKKALTSLVAELKTM